MAQTTSSPRWVRSIAFRVTWAVLLAVFSPMCLVFVFVALRSFPPVQPVATLIAMATMVAVYVRVWRTGVELRADTLVVHGFIVTSAWEYHKIRSFFVDDFYCKLQPVEGPARLVNSLQSSPFWTRRALDRTVERLNATVAERKGEVAMPLAPPTHRRMEWSTVVAIALAALVGGGHDG